MLCATLLNRVSGPSGHTNRTPEISIDTSSGSGVTTPVTPSFEAQVSLPPAVRLGARTVSVDAK